ncbi:hypothetical protein [Micromonospora sp. NPDC005203]|uniref:hypothetical protein n=1 Tax=Micromonospora sp. NPDC005203 TaxID=3364226 RepID=UPI0036B14048
MKSPTAILLEFVLLPSFPGSASTNADGNRGNTSTPYAIMANEYVGGGSAYQIAGRGQAALGGDRLAPYAGGNAWVLVLSADLQRRPTWTVVAGAVRGVAAGSGTAVAAARLDKAPFWRIRDVRSGGPPAGGTGSLAAWPGPS